MQLLLYISVTLIFGIPTFLKAYVPNYKAPDTLEQSEQSEITRGGPKDFQQLIAEYSALTIQLDEFSDRLTSATQRIEKLEIRIRKEEIRIADMESRLRSLNTPDSLPAISKNSDTVAAGDIYAVSHDSVRIKVERTLQGSREKLKDWITVSSGLVSDTSTLSAKLKAIRTNQSESLSQIQHASKGLHGSLTIHYRDVDYLLYIADLAKSEIRLHLKNENDDCKPFRNIGNLHKYLQSSSEEPIMIMNAGMYTPEREPQGLYIEFYDHYHGLDLRNPDVLANFYLKPNGVFFIDSAGRADIATSEEFDTILRDRSGTIKYATQSGPMLVIDRSIHPAFNYRSSNLHIRNGVGILPDGAVLFALSLQETNFYDFATVFLDFFSCSDALFLDGAISRMWLYDLRPKESGGDFGPMISVIKKTTP